MSDITHDAPERSQPARFGTSDSIPKAMFARWDLPANRRWLWIILLLLHFGLACYALDIRSLWGDEAYSVWASKQSLTGLVGGIDTQPPFSYLLMASTRALWGESVFALRFSSVCFGLLTVALIGRVGLMYLGRRGGAATALFLALSPLLIYFDQEARMYTLACAQCAATMWITARLATGEPQRRWPWIVALVLIAISALFTHFYTVAILLVNAVVWLVALIRRTHAMRSHWTYVEWVLAHIGIALAFGIWFFGVQMAVLSRSTTGRSALLPTVPDALRYLQEGGLGLGFGMRADGNLWPLAMLLLLVYLAGAVRLQRGKAVLMLGYLLSALAVALGTAALVPTFNARYFLFALLPLALLFGACFKAGATRLRWVLGIVFVASAIYGNRTVFDPTWAKSGYQALLQTIRTQQQAGDSVLLINSDQYVLYDYYGPLDPTLTPWVVRNDAQQATEAQFAQFVQGKRRVWVVNYGSATLQPSRFEQALGQRGVRILNQGFVDSALALYQLGLINPSDASGESTVLEAHFGPAIVLQQVRMHQSVLHPGEAVALDLIWKATEPPITDYTVFVHVRQSQPTDSANPANPLQFANDSAPLNGAAPTSGWRVGQIITDTHGVPIPDNAPAGIYDIVVGLYQYPSFERLPLKDSAATELIVGRVQVAAASDPQPTTVRQP